MAIGKDGVALRQLRTLFTVGTIRELTDGQLLERFATDRSEAAELAFAALVERHGPMVLRVCRGVLVDPHDAQDAFQATFLVLVRKARTLWVRDSLGPWLHQVAYRTASCARSAAARRRRHERSAALATEEGHAAVVDDLGRVLHEEIDRLPGRFREPLVLCDLEGRTHEQAARHLGWPVGTVKSRLSRGRERLRDRLRRRGHAPDLGPAAALSRPTGLEQSIPPALLDSTTSVAVQSVMVRTIVRGSAASLAQGVLRSMSMTRWLKAASVLLVLGATASGIVLLAQTGTSGIEPRPEGPPVANRADDLPVVEVKPGTLRLVVVERGVVEASNPKVVTCSVEGRTTILSILPEGSMVKKGDIVCELDSSGIRDRLVNRRIAEQGAEASYRDARQARESVEHALEAAEAKQGPPGKDARDERIGKLKGILEQKRADEVARKSAWELVQDEVWSLGKQIEGCKLLAPGDGILAYANDPNRFGIARPPAIEEGATVRERQIIVKVIDLRGPMRVNIKVKEAVIARIKPGLRARIKVDAFPGEVLSGTVQEIAPLPDSSSFFNSDLKVYTTRVAIDQGRPGLRPGLSAEVEIVVTELDHVLSIPLTAIIRRHEKDQVAVKQPGGGIEWREVALGESNFQDVEVKQGLRSGELVILNPLALLTEEEKREMFDARSQLTTKPDSPKARGRVARPRK